MGIILKKIPLQVGLFENLGIFLVNLAFYQNYCKKVNKIPIELSLFLTVWKSYNWVGSSVGLSIPVQNPTEYPPGGLKRKRDFTDDDAESASELELSIQSVSYTHLTLPTICSV